MALPTTYKIEYDGYQISGNVREGVRATIPFIMPWADAGLFIGGLIPSPTATTPGSIVWNPPFSITYGLGTKIVPLYAQSYVCRPMGYGGTPATSSGLGFGDYFSTAKITVEFESTSMIQKPGDDPSGLNQLDPNNPLTACEQSIQWTGKVETSDGSSWKYTSGSFSGKALKGPIGVVRPEARIMLNFPRIPVLPWQLIQPYIGKVNQTAIFNCVKGSLLLEAMPTVIKPNVDGSIAQSVGLAFAFNPDPTGQTITGMDWNSQPFPDQSGYSVIASTGGSLNPYGYAEFRQIFQTLQFGV